ncbi:hypothetical protein SERLADRAFT_414402 [Serpula lacrymans var. lacrymans S7.9]|uniref:F-box domain-containing protein n=1 Tax=Serpula lacrymans var. lacrymans (strain S7.9) TaxID=578457 RepID=F8NRQ3_SERL9|nr:uncharacterized protein SERLADRAFT_414402 [Serpula lacrymans var. lacrymans S7.9]EGO26319.1 hypothetical protein SERLADRAFT_414402 [Serpula lacrymans var. lacrymans S7.9]
MSTMDVPIEIFAHIIELVIDRRDLCSICLASHTLNAIATPLLYHTLDSRTISRNHNTFLCHPSSTLLRKPHLAKHVRHVTETDNDQSPSHAIHNIITILSSLPLRALTIRTRADLGQHVWKRISDFKNLQSVAVWSMEGPPRVLQGWAEHLSHSLTHLELGRCAGVPPSILISIFSHLPLLTSLLLKGANSSSIPPILALLPNLVFLDTDFLPTSLSRSPFTVSPIPPRLTHLTIRTGSVDLLGPQNLWWWISNLVPHKNTLHSFTLNAFTVQGAIHVPRGFLLDLAKTHSLTLSHFVVGVAQLALPDLSALCYHCTEIQTIGCGVASPDVSSIARATASAHNLRTLKLHVRWMPQVASTPSHKDEEEEEEASLTDDTNPAPFHDNHMHQPSPLPALSLPSTPTASSPGTLELNSSHPRPSGDLHPPVLSWPRFDTLLSSDGLMLSNSLQRFNYNFPVNQFHFPVHRQSPASTSSHDTDSHTLADVRALMLRPDSSLRTVGMGEEIYTGRWVLKTDAGQGSEIVFEVERDLDHER